MPQPAYRASHKNSPTSLPEFATIQRYPGWFWTSQWCGYCLFSSSDHQFIFYFNFTPRLLGFVDVPVVSLTPTSGRPGSWRTEQIETNGRRGFHSCLGNKWSVEKSISHEGECAGTSEANREGWREGGRGGGVGVKDGFGGWWGQTNFCKCMRTTRSCWQQLQNLSISNSEWEHGGESMEERAWEKVIKKVRIRELRGYKKRGERWKMENSVWGINYMYEKVWEGERVKEGVVILPSFRDQCLSRVQNCHALFCWRTGILSPRFQTMPHRSGLRVSSVSDILTPPLLSAF